MNLDLEDAVNRAALLRGFGLPQERLARMAAARTDVASLFGDLAAGEPVFDAAYGTFECIDAASAIESPFNAGENITV